mgnify:CR=1 FL=1
MYKIKTNKELILNDYVGKYYLERTGDKNISVHIWEKGIAGKIGKVLKRSSSIYSNFEIEENEAL